MILLQAAEFNFWSSPSILASFAILAIIVCIQVWIFLKTSSKLSEVKKFFEKEEDYGVEKGYRKIDNGNGEMVDEEILFLKDVAMPGSSLSGLIKDINAYIKETKGTTEFSIIKDKTQSAIDIKFDMANSKLSYPTHIGLMGTFIGILLGLISFLINYDPESLDASIQTLIGGVIVSMATSFIGLLLTTWGNAISSKTQESVESDQSEFYKFIQNKLMPTLDVSLVKAIEKLHHTVNEFEPAFTRIINNFESTFTRLTDAFGETFEKNVKAVTNAVKVMGENMEKINENIEGQKELLETLKSKEVIKSLERFVSASNHFEQVTTALEEFKTRTNDVFNITRQIVNTQQSYREHMEISIKATDRMAALLDRFDKFEESINGLGENIGEINKFDHEQVEALRQQIASIKQKQRIIDKYHETTQNQLGRTLKNEEQEFEKMAKKYKEFMQDCMADLAQASEDARKELQTRKQEFINELKERFTIEGVDKEFAKLSMLDKLEILDSINSKLDKVANNDAVKEVKSSIDAVKSGVEGTKSEVGKVKDAIDKKKVEVTVKRGGIFG